MQWTRKGPRGRAGRLALFLWRAGRPHRRGLRTPWERGKAVHSARMDKSPAHRSSLWTVRLRRMRDLPTLEADALRDGQLFELPTLHLPQPLFEIFSRQNPEKPASEPAAEEGPGDGDHEVNAVSLKRAAHGALVSHRMRPRPSTLKPMDSIAATAESRVLNTRAVFERASTRGPRLVPPRS